MAQNNEQTSLVVAVDIGGTFSDVALVDHATGRSWRAKTPSIPSDPSEAFLNGIRLALGQAGAAGADLDQVLHGTTVATNMILEGKGARAALVTTRGFRHVLAIGRQDIPRKANLYTWVKPVPPVPSSRIVEIDERVAAGGEVTGALNEDSVRAAAASIRGMDVEAVAVCLLHAYANPDHERRVAEILRQELPDLAITVSSDVLPVVREYERSLTTVLNATVMPGVTSYVARLEQRLKDEGATPPLMLMQSNGGVAGAAKIRVAPALTALSGPAAGVVGARAEAEACGISDIITVDIGGTSADICLIKDGKIGLTQQGAVGEWPLALPMVDMITIGAGGGSLARIKNGGLTVGPESAGARPGPASYGHGGTEPTVTDAHVVLGQLPARLLGGTMLLDTDAAHRAVASVADPLGIDMEAAARGILAIADNHMVGAIRVVSVERGHDPRDFTLVPFGGAGPLHGCALADLLGIRRVLITNAPGVLCANGLLVADLKSEFSRALAIAGPMNGPETESIVAELEAQAQSWLDDEDVVPEAREIERVALMRYAGQGGEIAVPWSPDPKVVEASFAETHKSLYGFTLSAPIELVTLRVHATGLARNAPGITLEPGETPEPSEFISVMIAGAPTSVPVIDRATLGAGSRFDGPAILIQLDTTTFVGPDWSATVHPSGNILLEKAAQ
ncbi:N-methylhydantoinase A [Monaibacterium marinum]|uniref:N-methylhydantoinase A n=1 Tax=Pontivivens marinum TaxID=1690039 RepID=A0A2C9CV94_9RHOB|nr:hydantoinase/oxoprolinase family protein [Monaibacterium marinum]SOH94319.1 N-methylhydantoinase A [Monaibacterium marinum]